jgi:hypothetical protein
MKKPGKSVIDHMFKEWEWYEEDPRHEKQRLVREIKEINRKMWHLKSPKRLAKLIEKMETEKLELEEELLKIL